MHTNLLILLPNYPQLPSVWPGSVSLLNAVVASRVFTTVYTCYHRNGFSENVITRSESTTMPGHRVISFFPPVLNNPSSTEGVRVVPSIVPEPKPRRAGHGCRRVDCVQLTVDLTRFQFDTCVRSNRREKRIVFISRGQYRTVRSTWRTYMSIWFFFKNFFFFLKGMWCCWSLSTNR